MNSELTTLKHNIPSNTWMNANKQTSKTLIGFYFYNYYSVMVHMLWKVSFLYVHYYTWCQSLKNEDSMSLCVGTPREEVSKRRRILYRFLVVIVNEVTLAQPLGFQTFFLWGEGVTKCHRGTPDLTNTLSWMMAPYPFRMFPPSWHFGCASRSLFKNSASPWLAASR